MFSRESATTEEENSEHEDDLPIDYMTLNITCRGLYNNLKTLLRDYNDLDNMVIVKEITFAKEGDSMAGVMANITFDFPYYQDNSSYELEAWPGGPIKDNDVDPFNYFIRGSALDPNVERSNYNNSIINSNAISDYINPLIPTKTVSYVDFYINARPKSSDDFAYTIGKKGDNANRLSSDLDGEELALHIVEVDGKPAFKLGTKLRPINEHTKAVLFSPQEGGTVNVDILSQPRVGNKDLTKAILTVKNTTAFPVKIRIKDEDVDSPRVVIMKEGNVTVE